jgi:hypothetical protein
MDITQKTIVELKALAFDELRKLEIAQKNLNIINGEIVKREQEEAKNLQEPSSK